MIKNLKFLKKGKGLEKIFFKTNKRKSKRAISARERTFHITGDWGHISENHNEISLYTH